jgi:hypothetical protein
MKRTRAALRQASKSDLARTNKALYGERSWLLAASARRWKRKLRHAVAVALILGSAAGYFAARAPWGLTAETIGRIFGP